MRRAICAAIVAVLANGVGGMSSAEAGGPLEIDWPHHQFNIAGKTQHNGGLVSANLVHYFVSTANPKPWVVTLQEVCSTQYTTLASQMGQLGYTARFATTRNFSSPASCSSYGNAMFLLGSSAPNGPIPSNVEELYSTSGSEPRKYECQRMTGLLGLYTACNTHIDFQSNVVDLQSEELHTLMNWFYPNDRRIVGGDFNQVSPPPWETDYRDVDPYGSRTYPVSPSPVARIDYVFGHQAHFPTLRSVWGPYCDSFYSDHCYVAGSYQF